MAAATPAPVAFAPEGPGFFEVILLLIVLIALLVGAYFATRYVGRAAQQSMFAKPSRSAKQRRRIVLLDRLMLDREKSVILFEAEGMRYLAGVSGESFTLLDKTEAPLEPPETSTCDAAAGQGTAGTFRELMNAWKKQENGEHAPEK